MSPAEEGRPPGEVGHRGPQLAGRGHGAGVVLRLGQHEVGERVHRQPGGGAPLRPGRRAPHPQRLEQLTADDLVPAAPVVLLEEPAERAVPDVGVVEAPARPEAPPHRRGGEGGPVAAGGALPPRPVRLGLHAPGVGEQLLHGDVVERRAGHVVAEAVGQLEATGVPQPEHAHRDEGLGDRAHPVLRVVVRALATGAAVHGTGGAAPHEGPAADDPGDERGHPAVALRAGQRGVEAGRGRGLDGLLGHRPTLGRWRERRLGGWAP